MVIDFLESTMIIYGSKNMKNIIDPKNPHTVGKSIANLGNHVLLTGFIGAIIFVIVASYG